MLGTLKARGLTLVELIVAMSVIAVGVAGIAAVFVMASRGSADPLVQKQALAIAEAVLEEVELMPFTYCDPDDPAADTATAPAACATPQGLGPTPGETRTSTATPFDNVGDYQGYDSATDAPPGIKDVAGTPIAGLQGYRMQVAVVQQAMPAVAGVPDIPAAASLLVSVTVTGPAGTTVRLHGYRTRHAPNALP